MATRPPNSNLSPEAQPWGRYVTNAIQQTDESLQFLTADIRNSEARNNASLDLLSTQVRELEARPATRYGWPTYVSPSFNQASGATSATIGALVVPPATRRWGWAVLNVTLSQSDPNQITDAQIRVRLGDQILQSSSLRLAYNNLQPNEWGTQISISAFTPFVAELNSQPVFYVDMVFTATGTAMRTVTVDRLGLVQFAQPDYSGIA